MNTSRFKTAFLSAFQETTSGFFGGALSSYLIVRLFHLTPTYPMIVFLAGFFLVATFLIRYIQMGKKSA